MKRTDFIKTLAAAPIVAYLYPNIKAEVFAEAPSPNFTSHLPVFEYYDPHRITKKELIEAMRLISEQGQYNAEITNKAINLLMEINQDRESPAIRIDQQDPDRGETWKLYNKAMQSAKIKKYPDYVIPNTTYTSFDDMVTVVREEA